MLKSLKSLFEQCLVAAKADPGHAAGAEQAYQLATATLLVEMMRADFDVHPSERDALEQALTNAYGLDAAEVAALIEQAHSEADRAISLHDFTNLINQHLSPQQKYHVIELLWRVAFADGEVDKYEDYLVRKVADLIYVPHRQFIRAKLAVQAALGTR